MCVGEKNCKIQIFSSFSTIKLCLLCYQCLAQSCRISPCFSPLSLWPCRLSIRQCSALFHKIIIKYLSILIYNPQNNNFVCMIKGPLSDSITSLVLTVVFRSSPESDGGIDMFCKNCCTVLGSDSISLIVKSTKRKICL